MHIDVDGVSSLAQRERLLQVAQFSPLVDDAHLVITMETTHCQLVSRQRVRLVRHPLVLKEVKDAASCRSQLQHSASVICQNTASSSVSRISLDLELDIYI